MSVWTRLLSTAAQQCARWVISLQENNFWRVPSSGGTGVLRPWMGVVTNDWLLRIPMPLTGQGFTDGLGRFWLYGRADVYAGATHLASYGATWDAPTATASAIWTVPAVSDSFNSGIVSAVSDVGIGDGTGLIAVTFNSPGVFNWVVHYPGTGTTASSTTTTDSGWIMAINAFPTHPRYAGWIWTLFRQPAAGALYALVMGDYTDAGGINHDAVPSLWVNTGDPTAASLWTFVRYFSHYSLSTMGGYWGSYHEDQLPARQAVPLDPDMYLTTPMDVITDTGVPIPVDKTVVWRMDTSGTAHASFSLPSTAGGMEIIGGPIAAIGADLYWAGFRFPSFYDVGTDHGTILLYVMHESVWTYLSDYTLPLSSVATPLICNMVAGAGGLLLLFDTGRHFFTTASDEAPALLRYTPGTDTWDVFAQISTPGSSAIDTPRIWLSRAPGACVDDLICPTAPFGQLWQVGAFSTGDAWIAGMYQDTFQDILYHWAGGTWTALPAPTYTFTYMGDAQPYDWLGGTWQAGGADLGSLWGCARFTVSDHPDPFLQNIFVAFKWTGSAWEYRASLDPDDPQWCDRYETLGFPGGPLVIDPDADVWVPSSINDFLHSRRLFRLRHYLGGTSWVLTDLPWPDGGSTGAGPHLAWDGSALWFAASTDTSGGGYAWMGSTTGVGYGTTYSEPADGGLSHAYQVYTAGTGTIWVCGWKQASTDPAPYAVVWMYTSGGGWVRSTLPAPTDATTSVASALAGRAADDIWCVGSYRGADGELRWVSWHYDGIAWTLVPVPPIVGGYNADPFALACNPARDEQWAVGWACDRWFAMRYSGGTWAAVAVPDLG